MNTSKPFLLGIDQGTSGSRALILDADGQPCGYGYRPLARLYPQPDQVEQDPLAVAEGVASAIAEALEQAGCRPDQIAACGIACQRNTDFVWDADCGQPLANAITWQDLRTLPLLEKAQAWPLADQYRRRLGRSVGVFSSALHLAWRMRHQPEVRAAAEAGRLRIGFSAAWLLQALGRPAGHQMDASLVQAMGLYDFRAQDYWEAWLDFLGIPRPALPTIRPTLYEYGHLRLTAKDGASAEVPVLAMIGDQQAALFGYDRRFPGDAECTHGTASFIDVCIGEQAPEQDKLNVYHAWQLAETARPTYCVEADTTVSGAALRWMRESARFLDKEDEVGPLAASVPDAGGVVFIPAFTGLNVPYDSPRARGTLLGMTLGTGRGHIARAFLESIGFQINDILATIETDLGLRVDQLHVGGGLAASDLACQIQANLIGIQVVRPEFTQTTARAAALLAGLGAGFWAGPHALPPLPGERRVFEPEMTDEQRQSACAGWQRAITTVQAYYHEA